MKFMLSQGIRNSDKQASRQAAGKFVSVSQRRRRCSPIRLSLPCSLSFLLRSFRRIVRNNVVVRRKDTTPRRAYIPGVRDVTSKDVRSGRSNGGVEVPSMAREGI